MPYLIAIVLQVFAFYWHANEVREQSLQIAEAAYNGPWIDVNNSVKKKLLLISLNAQRPLEVGRIFCFVFVELTSSFFLFSDYTGKRFPDDAGDVSIFAQGILFLLHSIETTSSLRKLRSTLLWVTVIS